jgi:hypothetical protein
MESEKRILELQKLGQASAGDPNEIIESKYWAGFTESWASGLSEGLTSGRARAMQELNIFKSKIN